MRRLSVLLAGLLLLPACREGERPLRIGSKNFSEQVLLGEILSQALEGRGLRVDRRLNLGGTFVCHNALVAGELDAYPEYTGTAFTAILTQKPIPDPPAVRRLVAEEYRKRWDLTWGPPLGFENTFAIVVRAEDARRLNLRRISDLSANPQLRPGFGYEFLEREDGYPGLARAYGLRFERRPAQMDLGLLYQALQSRAVDLVAGNSTDGLIAALDLVVLEDDRRYFPPYEAAYVARGPLWRQTAAFRETVESLGGALSAERMRLLNAEIDEKKRRPEDVAKEFLSQRPGRRTG